MTQRGANGFYVAETAGNCTETQRMESIAVQLHTDRFFPMQFVKIV